MYKPHYPLLAVLILLSTACSLPSPVSPLTPTPISQASLVSPSATLPVIATESFTQTASIQGTATIQPTETQAMQVPVTPTAIVETVQPEDAHRFDVQAGTPIETSNFLYPDLGCDWMGVGGQVFSQNDRPITGLVVEVGGILDASPILLLSMTGDSTALGLGGYEIKLADKLIASQGTLWLQLHDLNGKPQSEKVYFNTYSGENECERNLIVINFREVRTTPLEQYLPSIFRGP